MFGVEWQYVYVGKTTVEGIFGKRTTYLGRMYKVYYMHLFGKRRSILKLRVSMTNRSITTPKDIS